MTPSSSLMGAARAFLRRSSETSVLAIAPLALATFAAPSAEAQVTWGNATSATIDARYQTGLSFATPDSYPDVIGGAPLTAITDPIFNTATSTTLRFGATSVSYFDTLSGGGSTHELALSDGNTSSGFASAGVMTVAYDFDVTLASGSRVGGYSIALELFGAGGVSLGQQVIAGTSSADYFTESFPGNLSGTGEYDLTTGSTITGYELKVLLALPEGGSPDYSHWSIEMDEGAGQGFTFQQFTAIPEPSATTLFVGLFAFGAVARRRRRSVSV